MKFLHNYHEDTHINGMSSSIILIIKGYFPYVLSRYIAFRCLRLVQMESGWVINTCDLEVI